MFSETTALILVDLQNDFCPGGALAVPKGDEVIEVANMQMSEFKHIVATQDWHTAEHKSFASNNLDKKPGDIILLNGIQQILWPDHCIQNSYGAKFHSALQLNKINYIQKKGSNPELDSYSGFFENDRKTATKLSQHLHESGIENLYIMGLATDYCVKYTVLDALDLGFNVCLIEAGCRAINLNPDDDQTALLEMEDAGAVII